MVGIDGSREGTGQSVYLRQQMSVIMGLTIFGYGYKVVMLGFLPLGLLGLPFVVLRLLIGLLPVKAVSRGGGN